ncbi:MAG TPA: trehalose-phosphatase, partial [Chthoniobacterales bacterium]
VNPYDATAVAQKLTEALEMPDEEKRACNQPMRERVMKYDAQHWARTFIQQLDSMAGAAHAMSEEDPAAAAERIRHAIAAGQRIALFLDYDGTLRELERDPRSARPTGEIRALLEELHSLPNVGVFIVSGRSHQDLELFFPESEFALVAEHGAALRRPGEGSWQAMDRDITYTWKDEIRELLRLYEQSTPGSWVEEKRTSLVWHFRKTDPEFGTWKANQLTHELGTMMANEPVRIRQGRKIVEVTSSEVSKALAVRHLLHDEPYDLVICAGDDQTDESMFEIEEPHFLSIKVGPEPTRARYRLRDPAAFRRFLRETLLASKAQTFAAARA